MPTQYWFCDSSYKSGKVPCPKSIPHSLFRSDGFLVSESDTIFVVANRALLKRRPIEIVFQLPADSAMFSANGELSSSNELL